MLPTFVVMIYRPYNDVPGKWIWNHQIEFGKKFNKGWYSIIYLFSSYLEHVHIIYQSKIFPFLNVFKYFHFVGLVIIWSYLWCAFGLQICKCYLAILQNAIRFAFEFLCHWYCKTFNLTNMYRHINGKINNLNDIEDYWKMHSTY